MMDIARTIGVRSALTPAAVALALVLPGCGERPSSPVPESGEERLVSDVVENFNEARLNVKQSESLFAKGAMPAKAEFKKYSQFSYWPNVGGPILSGDTAAMKVAVRDERTGDDAGQVEWTFAKEGSDWKIKSAPLP